jgi:hypothetical protein
MIRTISQPNSTPNSSVYKTIKWESPAVRRILSQETIQLVKRGVNDPPEEIIVLEIHNFLERFPLPLTVLPEDQYASIVSTISEMVRKNLRGKLMLRQHYEKQQTHNNPMWENVPWRQSSWRPALYAMNPHSNHVELRDQKDKVPDNLFDNHPKITQDNFHAGFRGSTSSTREKTVSMNKVKSKARAVLPFRP